VEPRALSASQLPTVSEPGADGASATRPDARPDRRRLVRAPGRNPGLQRPNGKNPGRALPGAAGKRQPTDRRTARKWSRTSTGESSS